MSPPSTITWYLQRETIGKNNYKAMIDSIAFGLSLWGKAANFKLIDNLDDRSRLLHVTLYMRAIADNEYPSIAITEPVNDHHANIALDADSQWNTNTVHWWNRLFGSGHDLSRTVTHEMGHCVGLRHTPVVSSIMVQRELELPSKPSAQDITNFASRVAAKSALLN